MDLKLRNNNLKPKMSKLTDDPCFGLLHEQIDQCSNCWIKRSCATRFRNLQSKKGKK